MPPEIFFISLKPAGLLKVEKIFFVETAEAPNPQASAPTGKKMFCEKLFTENRISM